MRKALMATAMLTGCVSFGGDDGPMRVADEAAATRGERCGIDRGALDEDVSPREDFVAYTTGGWTQSGPVTAALEAAARDRLEDVVTPSDAFVAAYLARDPSDTVGAEALIEEAKTLLTTRDRGALAEAAGLAALRGGTTPLRFGAYPDPEDPARRVPIVAAGGAPLGDPEAYEANADAYAARVVATLEMLGAVNVERLAARVVAFERRLAEAVAAAETDYTRREVESLARLRRGDPWRRYFETVGVEDDEALLRDISALSQVTRAWRNERPGTIAAYLAFHRLSDVADFLPEGFGGTRREGTARAVAERIFVAEEGAPLRGQVTGETKTLAEAVARAVAPPDTEIIVAGGPPLFDVPSEAARATAEGVEAAALARGRARAQRLGEEVRPRDRLASPLSARPRLDRATSTLDLPAALLQGPVFATNDAPSVYGALGGLIALRTGAPVDEALTRARAAFEASDADETGRRCGLTAEQRFYIGFAQGLRGEASARAVNAAVRADAGWNAAFED